MYSLLGGFLLGLAGSLHCAGMCGPIAIALPGGRVQKFASGQTVQKLLYQLGRVTTYSILGVLVGLTGSAIRLAGYSRTLSVASGVLMIVAAIAQFSFRRDWSILSPFRGSVTWLQQRLKTLLATRGALAHFGIGLANGLLPCGLVTTALFGALASGSIYSGAAYMALFGLGTVPLMSAIALGFAALPCNWRKRLPLIAPIAGLALGALVLVRGMGLGIPYVSPAPPTALHHDCCSH
jgi:uncharacterized protein